MNELLMHALVQILTNSVVIGLGIGSACAAGTFVLRKIPNSYIDEKHKAQIQTIFEAFVHDAMPDANIIRAANGGDIPPAEGAKLMADVKARAINAAEARGLEVAKLMEPEVIDWALHKAVATVKGVKKLPAGTAAALPLILLMLGLSGCATFPAGFDNVQPISLTQVAAGLDHLGQDPILRAVVNGSASAAAHTYIADRMAGKDQSESAADAAKAAIAWAADNAKSQLGGKSLRDYLVTNTGLDPSLTDADVLVGLVKWQLANMNWKGVSSGQPSVDK